MNSPEQVEDHKEYFAAHAIANSSTFDLLDDSDITGAPKPIQVDWWDDLEIVNVFISGRSHIFSFRLPMAEFKPKQRLFSSFTLIDEVELHDTIASESPFEDLDQRLDVKKRIEGLINYIRDESNIQFAKRLADRIDALCEAAEEEDPDETPILPESLTNFLAFLREVKTPRYPDVVLTPGHEVRARWNEAPNRHFSVVFLPTGSVRYVIFKPNSVYPESTDRLSGITASESLLETIELHGVLHWVSE